jgi:hypothetical protein
MADEVSGSDGDGATIKDVSRTHGQSQDHKSFFVASMLLSVI